MPTRIRKFPDIFALETFLNGGLVGGLVGSSPGSPAGLLVGIYGLVGKTLRFTSPSATVVTFVAASGAGSSVDPAVPAEQRNPDPQTLLFKDIKLQIETAINTVRVLQAGGRIVLIEATPTNGVVLDNTGTASALLGFDNSGSTVGKVFAPPPSADAPCWVWHTIDGSNSHVIFTLE